MTASDQLSSGVLPLSLRPVTYQLQYLNQIYQKVIFLNPTSDLFISTCNCIVVINKMKKIRKNMKYFTICSTLFTVMKKKNNNTAP